MSLYVFPKKNRLLKTADFRRTLDRGRKGGLPLLVVLARPNDLGDCRLGVIASRKVGKAVERNRVKRRLRECFRLLKLNLPLEGYDFVFIARKRATFASMFEIQQAVERAVEKFCCRTPGPSKGER